MVIGVFTDKSAVLYCISDPNLFWVIFTFIVQLHLFVSVGLSYFLFFVIFKQSFITFYDSCMNLSFSHVCAWSHTLALSPTLLFSKEDVVALDMSLACPQPANGSLTFNKSFGTRLSFVCLFYTTKNV